ncbi:hypothetical protein PG994_012170 [Apiospora phragmitis]|uniref:Uncharacterized protein n=1 Tax=Apiospora phragmitis TaxID=2905665 RepID=A0ABR1TUU1_9PEZI
MVSSSNSIRKRQSLAWVAMLGPYACVDQPEMRDPAARAMTPLTAVLEQGLRGRGSNDSISAVVATRPDAEELTRKRERRRSTVSSATSCGADRGRQPGRRQSGRSRRTSIESERSRDRATLVTGSVTSSSPYSHLSESPSPTLESAGRQYLTEQLERRRAEIALCGGGGDGSSAVVDDSIHDCRNRRRSAVLRPTDGNVQPYKARSEAAYYPSSGGGRDTRRKSRTYPPVVQTGFDEIPHWASDAMKGLVLSGGDKPSSDSRRHDKSSRRSSTATVMAPTSYLEQVPKTPTTEPRGRKRRGSVSAKSISGATDDRDDTKSTYSGYSAYSTATFSHYPRGDGNPYYSATKRTSWRPSSGVESSRARYLAAAADRQRKLEQEQERVRQLERARERGRERERRQPQKQTQKEVLRVDSVNFDMCSPPSPAATTTTATTTTPMSVALHDFKEDQKVRAGLTPPDPAKDYSSYYYKHHRERKREYRAPEQREHHQEEEVRHHQHRRTRRSSLQQQATTPPPPPESTPVPTTSAEPPSSPSPRESFAGRMASGNTSSSQQKKQHHVSAYRPAMASETIPQLNNIVHTAPAATRQDQERRELFCRATRRGGRPEQFLRQPGSGSAGGDARQPAKVTMAENPSAALRLRAQENIKGQRQEGLGSGLNKDSGTRGPQNDGGITRLDSLYLPRNNNAAATANSYRRSFFEPQWTWQQQQQQCHQQPQRSRLPTEADEPSALPNPAASVVSVSSDFSFVPGQPEKLDVPPQRSLYAPGGIDDRYGLPSQSPSPPARGGGGSARRLRRTGDINFAQITR